MKLGYSLIAADELKLYFPKHKNTCLGTEDLYKAQKSYKPNPPTCTYIITLTKKKTKNTPNQNHTEQPVSAFYTAGKRLLKLS